MNDRVHTGNPLAKARLILQPLEIVSSRAAECIAQPRQTNSGVNHEH